MKRYNLKQKLEILKAEIIQTKTIEDEYTKEYLNNLVKLINKYLVKLDKKTLNASNGDNLGFRRAILEYDNLAEIDSLYDAACEVDNYYSNECKEW